MIKRYYGLFNRLVKVIGGLSKLSGLGLLGF